MFGSWVFQFSKCIRKAGFQFRQQFLWPFKSIITCLSTMRRSVGKVQVTNLFHKGQLHNLIMCFAKKLCSWHKLPLPLHFHNNSTLLCKVWMKISNRVLAYTSNFPLMTTACTFVQAMRRCQLLQCNCFILWTSEWCKLALLRQSNSSSLNTINSTMWHGQWLDVCLNGLLINHWF